MHPPSVHEINTIFEGTERAESAKPNSLTESSLAPSMEPTIASCNGSRPDNFLYERHTSSSFHTSASLEREKSRSRQQLMLQKKAEIEDYLKHYTKVNNHCAKADTTI